MWFYLILETDITHQLLVHNQVFKYGIKCCVGYIYPNFRRCVWSNMVCHYSKPIDYISCWVGPTDMYCCSCCYFCHPSWSWTQQQQRLIYAMRSLTQTHVSSGPKSNGARFFPLSECHPLRVSRWTQTVLFPQICFTVK